MSGITAIDLTDESGVFASRILADLGADVIRVEPPDGGAFRLRAPFLGKSLDIEKSFHHLYHNANKRSLVLDLNEGADGGVMARLVESAHMLLYSGTELPAGLDESRIRAANARIILVAISPYGRTGPYSRRSANDLTAAAAGGLIQVSGRPDQTPVQAAADQSYKMAGLIAATGAMLALTGQEVQGMAGGTLDVSLQEAVMAALIQTSNANRYLWHGRVPKRPGLGGNVVRCADDKWITINIRPDRFGEFLDWVRAEGLETDLTEADWAQAGAESRTPAVDSLIRALAAKYDRESYFEKAWSLGVLGLPVQTFADFASCEHFAFTQQFIDVADTGRGVKLSYPRSPVADATAVQIRPAPRLGEHSAEIRAQLDKRRTLSEAPAPFDPRELLSGIRVLDFTIALAGPLTTRTFANFGAEVITVESATRPVNPRVSVRPPGYADLNLGGIHNVAGTGKLSITLDLSQAEALPIVENLVRQSDIIANNFRPGVMDKLGLGYERVRELKPDAIYLSMPGCASSGPWRDRGTLGPMLAGASGLNALTGFPDQPPYGIGVAYPDFVAPYIAATAVLAALRRRRLTGLGSWIDTSQLSAVVSLLGVEWLEFAATGSEPARKANRDPDYAPHGVYPAAGEDQWCAIAVKGDEEWQRFCAAIGRPELLENESYKTHGRRKRNEDALDAEVSSWTHGCDKWQLSDVLQERGIAASPVEDLRDHIEVDPQLRDHFQSIRQPCDPEQEVLVDREPIRFAGHELALRRAPMLGEHNEYVFKDLLAMSEADIDRLIVARVIH